MHAAASPVPLAEHVNFVPVTVVPSIYAGGGEYESAVDHFLDACVLRDDVSRAMSAPCIDRLAALAGEAFSVWRGHDLARACWPSDLSKRFEVEDHLVFSTALGDVVNASAHGWLFEDRACRGEPTSAFPLVGVFGGAGVRGLCARGEDVQAAGDEALIPSDQHLHTVEQLPGALLFGSDSARLSVRLAEDSDAWVWGWVVVVDPRPSVTRVLRALWVLLRPVVVPAVRPFSGALCRGACKEAHKLWQALPAGLLAAARIPAGGLASSLESQLAALLEHECESDQVAG